MKKFAILILLFNSSWTFASETDVHGNDCNLIADTAKMVMELRQRQTPMSKLYSKADGVEFFENMIVSAYEKPAYQTESHQQRVVTEFADLYFMACVK